MVHRVYWRWWFFYNRGDLAFVISQATTDIVVLHNIKETLGFGKVIYQSLKTSRYVTQNKKEIGIILSLFNGNIVLPTKQKTFEKYIKGFNDWADKGSIKLEPVKAINNLIYPWLDNSRLVGFTDAVGFLHVQLVRKKGLGLIILLLKKVKVIWLFKKNFRNYSKLV